MGIRTALFIAIASLTGACAVAGHADEGERPDGGGFVRIDADRGSGGDVDAPAGTVDAFVPMIDGAPSPSAVTLSQTTDNTLAVGNSIACPGADGTGTSQNSYYRVFDLTAAGITTAFDVSQVSFQVEDSESATDDGSVVTVSVGTYGATPGATLTPGKISILQSTASVAVPEIDETATATPGGTINAPIAATIPAGSQLIIEVDSDDGTDEWQLYMGSSKGGESSISYVSTQSQCTTPGKTPKSISTVAGHAVDLLMTVTGTPE